MEEQCTPLDPASTDSSPTSPAKKLSFSVDSLLSISAAPEERPSSKNSASDTQADYQAEQQSDCSGRSSPESDISSSNQKSDIPVSASMAAALHQRASFMRHTAPQLPHSALLYPWLMSAGLMNNPTAALLASTTQQPPTSK